MIFIFIFFLYRQISISTYNRYTLYVRAPPAASSEILNNNNNWHQITTSCVIRALKLKSHRVCLCRGSFRTCYFYSFFHWAPILSRVFTLLCTNSAVYIREIELEKTVILDVIIVRAEFGLSPWNPGLNWRQNYNWTKDKCILFILSVCRSRIKNCSGT